MATLISWMVIENWNSEYSQFARIHELRDELLSYERLLRLLVPPSLAPTLIDRAYRESQGGGGGAKRKGKGKIGGGTSGIFPQETGGIWQSMGPAADAGRSERGMGAGGTSGLPPGFHSSSPGGSASGAHAAQGGERFAERFDEASVLFAEGEGGPFVRRKPFVRLQYIPDLNSK